MFSCFKVEEEYIGKEPEPSIQRHSVNKKKDLPVVIFNDKDKVYSWHPQI